MTAVAGPRGIVSPRAVVALALGALAAMAVGCGHDQKKEARIPQSTSVAATPPRRTPPPSPAPSPAPAPAAETLARDDRAADSDAKAVYFDYDTAFLREDARPPLRQVADEVKKHPRETLRIEGNCDERGTTEYNLALGEERAKTARDYLVRLGVPQKKIRITTNGSQRPKATGHDESSWAENRRDDLILK